MVRFVVHGNPAPQGSKRIGRVRGSGRPILIDDCKRTKPWRMYVHAAAVTARAGAAPLDGPLRVRMVFTMPKPVSAPKRRRTLPCTKPDVSKLARSTEDALVDAGLIRDDARIVEYSRLAKVYPGEDPESMASPGVRIAIEMVDTSQVVGTR